MKIAIDASRAVTESAGIGRYTRELVLKLLEIDKKNQYLIIFSFFRKDAQKAKLIKQFERSNVKIKILPLPGQLKEKIWDWQLPWYRLVVKDADVFYAPSFLEVNLGLNIPQVVTIYDLTTFIFPEHRGGKIAEKLNRKCAQAVKRAAKIVAISKSTVKDLNRYLKISPAKIEVIYPGNHELTVEKTLPNGLKKDKFILNVGTLEPRKNLIGLLKAYALLPPALQSEYPLVIVGAEGWNTGKIFETYHHFNLEGKVKFLGFVKDNRLGKLYQEAAVFVYPSLYEGFGFPVLEALSFGTPVITSNVSSLPEVAGSSAIFIDPNNPHEISTAIERLLVNQEERQKLKGLAKIQAQKFSWDKAARQILRIFEKTAIEGKKTL